MAVTVRIALAVTFLTFASCVQLHKLHSSYFKFSHQKRENEESDKIAEFKAQTELTCALRCSAKGTCDEATFYRNSKKCFLYQNKGKGSTELYANGNDNTRSKIVTMKKVCINPSLINGGCTSGDDNGKDENENDEDDGDNNDEWYSSVTGNVTKKSSCSSILRQNSSSQNGFYNITVGAITWKTWCEMNAIPGCGDGAWTLVMSINGSRKTFSYDSNRWTNKSFHYETATQGKAENKLPGYWLSPFSRICVKMEFLPSDRRAVTVALLNYTSESLYSAIQEGINNTWPEDISAMKQFPLNGSHNINGSCLVKGFNLIAQVQHPKLTIRSRIGVQSQHLECAQPYLVRGVGIDYRQDYPEISEISCGEIVINHQNSKTETHPAFCSIYIQ